MHGDIASTPRSSGEVRYDTAARTAAADDFGHLVHHTPRTRRAAPVRRRRGGSDPGGRTAGYAGRRAGPPPLGVGPVAGPRRRRDRHVDPRGDPERRGRPGERRGGRDVERRPGRDAPGGPDAAGPARVPRAVRRRHAGRRGRRWHDLDVRHGERHRDGAGGGHRTRGDAHLLAGEERRPVRRGSRRARTVRRHHPGDAALRRGAAGGAAVPVVLPDPGCDGARFAACWPETTGSTW